MTIDKIVELVSTSFILPLIIAWITTFVTIKHERGRNITELKRELYFDVLRYLSKILINPTLIYDDAYRDTLLELGLRMDVYAGKKILEPFQEFLKNAEDKYINHKMKFYGEDVCDERQVLKADPLFGEALEKEEEDDMICNLPEMGQVEKMAKELKAKIQRLLRRG